MDFISINIRQAGENFTGNFPAIELANGASGASDQLTIRRNLLDEVLKLCSPISAGSTDSQLYFAYPGTEEGCGGSDNTHNFTEWQTYRLANSGLATNAYIFNRSTGNGEFFTYTNEGGSGDSLYIETTASGAWSYDYPVGPTAIYLIEEWKFELQK